MSARAAFHASIKVLEVAGPDRALRFFADECIRTGVVDPARDQFFLPMVHAERSRVDPTPATAVRFMAGWRFMPPEVAAYYARPEDALRQGRA